MGRSEEPTREELLGLVRQAYVSGDPVPGGLISRMQAAAAGAAEESGLGLDLELMLLVESSSDVEAAGVRSAAPASARSAYTLRFAQSGVDVLVRVASDTDTTARLDGWVVPGSPMTVRAIRADEVRTPIVAVTLGASGRFELTSLPAGLIRLRFEPADGSAAFLTPTFEI
ncbi:hypothetical protein SAMN05428985_102759 [Nocardioides sp. YR527]|uniref:hypothetical protein n=1 Tax=Nocardioides sp. YR527 TaxID=1881028 RepID=UPI00088206F4|nr:hypothetical protein [Nocardioides sp. YR527]SDK11928.1 hypothetical protein SAMN05428985_102759 [Nocardioides sp. YR527]